MRPYLVHGPARAASFFDPVVFARSSRAGRSCACCASRATSRIARWSWNRQLLHVTADGVRERTIGSLRELRRAVDEDFQMPRCPVEEAVAVLERLNAREFFGDDRWRDTSD